MAESVEHLYGVIIARLAAAGRSGRHAAAWLPVLALTFLWAPGVAQELPAMREGRATYLELSGLARWLGAIWSESETSVTLRLDEGVLTGFEGSPDVLWQGASAPAEEHTLAAPMLHREGAWWLPADALTLLGVTVEADEVRDAAGRRAPLGWRAEPGEAGADGELVELRNGVPALRLYAAGAAGAAGISLLLVDGGLLGLAYPAYGEALDDLELRAGADRPLVVVVTALEEGDWEARLTFRQDGLETEAAYPFRLRLLEGDAVRVGPDDPVLGVVLLPEGFNLRRPIEVGWAGATASVTFRR